MLERLAELVRCDAIGAALTDPDGYVVDEVELPKGHNATLSDSGCDGPLRIGVVHWRTVPGHAERIRADGLSDSVAVGFRNGRDRSCSCGGTGGPGSSHHVTSRS